MWLPIPPGGVPKRQPWIPLPEHMKPNNTKKSATKPEDDQDRDVSGSSSKQRGN